MTLDEAIPFDDPPSQLPISTRREFADRNVGGAY
jgi:hypothetical protein